MVVNTRKSRRLLLRMPVWVDRSKVKCAVDGRSADPVWIGRLLLFEDLPNQVQVSVEFPVAERNEKVALDQNEYSVQFRGNTVIGISPKQEGVGYPIYEREAFRNPEAPMRDAPKYTAEKTLIWV